MPPPKDRDFPVSQYYAIWYGEQPQLKRRRKIRTPDERTLPRVLADLYQLTGFVPPSEGESGADLAESDIPVDDDQPPAEDQ